MDELKTGDYYWAQHPDGKIEIVRIWSGSTRCTVIVLTGDEKIRTLAHVTLLQKIQAYTPQTAPRGALSP